METSTSVTKLVQQDPGYSWKLGFVYVFNLLVGAAILALPKAFAQTGWLLALAFLIVLALMSFITVTFTVEAMSMSNALLAYKAEQKRSKAIRALVDSNSENEKKEAEAKDAVIENMNVRETIDATSTDVVVFNKAEESVIVNNNEFDVQTQVELEDDIYDIRVNVDLGEMSRMFFHKAGAFLYYVSLCLYLYGGLSIYTAAVAKSLTTVVCNDPKCFEGNGSSPCQSIKSLSVINVYKIMLGTFMILICPFAYFNISETKIIQIFTTVYRWFAMISMIILSFIKVGDGVKRRTPKLAVFGNLPNYFGVALYSFMCQHSIPAVLTPVTKSKRLHQLVLLDFICVIIFYATILMSAVFAFPTDELQDLYTLNFENPLFFRYLLGLFPVLTLSANFPILAIVLRQNLKNLFLRDSAKNYGIFLGRIFFPSIVILPPLCVAYVTYDVGMLVGYTGTYAGAIIQYVVPTMLVYCGRRKMMRLFKTYNNMYRSPFRHQFWVVLLLVWYVVSLVFVIYSKLQ